MNALSHAIGWKTICNSKFDVPICGNSSIDFPTGVLIMASVMLAFLVAWMIVILATTSSSSGTSNGGWSSGGSGGKNHNPTKNAVEAFSTFCQSQRTRLQFQTNRALLRMVGGSSGSSSSKDSACKWWEDLKTPQIHSPFRLLLPEEEDELFFADASDEALLWNESERTIDSTSAATASATEAGAWPVNQFSTSDPALSSSSSFAVTHFCFLVHGHRGHSRDLSYGQAVMRRYLQTQSQQQLQQATNASATAAENEASSARLVVHSCTCNEKKTDDGIAAGGERLLQEILSVIRQTMGRPTMGNATAIAGDDSSLQHVTISLWGNSLGGLYARYAIAKLKQQCLESCTRHKHDDETTDKDVSQSCYCVLDDSYAVHLNIFCTTATPHLGVSGHTFVALPRRAEIGVARAMGETGRDLFRLNALLHTMAVEEEFLQPLSHFRKRICYANAYGTDFPVPASTAAFLSSSSNYPHLFHQNNNNNNNNENETDSFSNGGSSGKAVDSINEDDGDGNNNGDGIIAQGEGEPSQKSSMVIATLHTPTVSECDVARGIYDSSTKSRMNKEGAWTTTTTTASSTDGDEDSAVIGGDDNYDDDEADAELAQMSISLDALGWKKVFVDMRRQVPRISFPMSLLRRSSGVKEQGGGDDGGTGVAGSLSNRSEMTSSSEEETILTSEPLPTVSDESDAAGSSIAQQQQQQTSMDPMDRLKGRGGVVSSRDVAAAVLTTALPDDRLAFHWPMGHNMIVAHSRSRWSTYMNKAGRPVVDALAKELVSDIFAFERPSTNTNETAQ